MVPTSTLTLPLPALGSHSPSHLNAPPASVFLLGSAVLRDSLGSQFSQHIIQVIGIWVAMAREIRAKLCLVVHLIPDDGIRLARGAGGTDGKDEAAIPGHEKQLQNFSPFLAVWKVTVSWEATGAETLARIWVLWSLNARGDAVDNPDGFAVWVARQGVRDEVVLHLPWRLGACLHPINGLTGWTLQTPILVPVVVHGDQAVDMVDVAAPGQLSYQVRLDCGLRALVARGCCEALHADGAVLLWWVTDLLQILL